MNEKPYLVEDPTQLLATTGFLPPRSSLLVLHPRTISPPLLLPNSCHGHAGAPRNCGSSWREQPQQRRHPAQQQWCASMPSLRRQPRPQPALVGDLPDEKRAASCGRSPGHQCGRARERTRGADRGEVLLLLHSFPAVLSSF